MSSFVFKIMGVGCRGAGSSGRVERALITASAALVAPAGLVFRSYALEISGLRCQSPGFRVQGSGSRVRGSGFRVQGTGFRVQGSAGCEWRRRAACALSTACAALAAPAGVS